MTNRIPWWLTLALVVQLLLAIIFFYWGYSLTSSMARQHGRTAMTIDVIALAMPIFAVAVFGFLSVRAWRRSKQSLAAWLALLPLPISFLAFIALGAI